MNNYYYVILADSQIGFPNKCEEYFTNSCKKINEMVPRPTFVVLVGDMVHIEFVNQKIPNLKYAEEVYETYKKCNKIPFHNVAGNHDIGDFPTVETIEWYKKHFGEMYYTFTVKSDLFIVLESNILKRYYSSKIDTKVKEIANNELKWLEKTLKENHKKFKCITIFMHHPVHLTSKKVSVNSYSYFALPEKMKNRLISIFQRYKNVKCVFSGHYHQEVSVKEEGIEYVVTNSVGMPLKQYKSFKTPPGLRVVYMKDSEPSHNYFEVENIPKKVELE